MTTRAVHLISPLLTPPLQPWRAASACKAGLLPEAHTTSVASTNASPLSFAALARCFSLKVGILPESILPKMLVDRLVLKGTVLQVRLPLLGGLVCWLAAAQCPRCWCTA